jgi:hypothetical protein
VEAEKLDRASAGLLSVISLRKLIKCFREITCGAMGMEEMVKQVTWGDLVQARSQLPHSSSLRRMKGEPLVLSADYVVGLVDGEGCFSVRLNRSKRRRAKIEMRFCVKLRAGDKEILEKLKEFFNCGHVYKQIDKRVNHSLCYRYEVQNRRELAGTIIPFFKSYMPKMPSKKRDFEIFHNIMQLVKRNRHRTEEGIARIEQLKAQMHLGPAVCGKSARTVGMP